MCMLAEVVIKSILDLDVNLKEMVFYLRICQKNVHIIKSHCPKMFTIFLGVTDFNWDVETYRKKLLYLGILKPF